MVVKVGRGCRNAVVWVGASLRRLYATAIVHPCTSCLLCWFRIVRNFGQALSRILAFAVVWVAASCSDFVRPPSCILCTFMNALLVSHPCETLGVHFIRHPCLTRKLRVLAPAAPKIIPRLLSGRKCSGVVESCLLCWFRILAKLWASTITHPCVCGRLGRCIVQRLCATAIVHPLHVYERSVGFASLPRQPFELPHRVATKCGWL